MGHTKEKFEGLLEDNKTPAQPRDFDLGKAMTETLTAMKKTMTYCMELSHEFLKAQSGNFTRTAINYDAEGLVVLYHCSRDDRTYTVKITASK
jgi:hypothetical protein